MEFEDIYSRILGAIKASRAENNACTASDVARRLNIHKTYISPKLHDMRAAGLVTFTAMPGSIALVENPQPVTAEDLGGITPAPEPEPVVVVEVVPVPVVAHSVPKEKRKPVEKRRRLSQEEMGEEEAKDVIKKQLSEKQIAHLTSLNARLRAERESKLAAAAAAAPGQVWE